MKNSRAIVLGLDHANPLGTIRSLGYEKIPTVGFHLRNNGDPLALYSKYLESAKIVESEKELMHSLKKFGESQDEKGVLFPTGDFYLVFCSRNLDELSDYFHVPKFPKMSLEDSLDKNKNTGIGKKSGFSVPWSTYLTDFNETTNDQIMVKPINSVAAPKSKMMWYENGDKLLADKQKLLEHYGNMVVQQFIPGGSNNLVEVHGYNSSQGVVIAGMQRNNLGTKANDHVYGGINFETIWIEELLPSSERLIKDLEFNGAIDINLKKSDLDGKYYFMEFNPRTSSNVALDTFAGLNLPAIIYHDLTGKDFSPLLDKERIEGVGWLYEKGIRKFLDQGGSIEDLSQALKKVKVRVFYDPEDPDPFNNQEFDEQTKEILSPQGKFI